MSKQPTPELSFDRLVAAIQQVHAEMAAQAGRAVNMSLTLRSWLIGFYIAEYERQGTDCARYGEALLDRLSSSLTQAGVSRAEARELRRYRQFYTTYPRIWDSPTPELKAKMLPGAAIAAARIRETVTPESG